MSAGPQARAGSAGCALLAVVVVGAGIALLGALVGRMVVELASAHRARADVQCARMAAHAAAALWPDALAHFAAVAPRAREPSWSVVSKRDDLCRLVVETACGVARRSVVVAVRRSGECHDLDPATGDRQGELGAAKRRGRMQGTKPFANFSAAAHYPRRVGVHHARRHRRVRQDDAGRPARRASAQSRP